MKYPYPGRKERKTEMSKNPLFQALGGTQPNPMTDFQKFMQQMQGRNPHEEINRMLQAGSITQDQLNMAQKRAQQMMNALSMLNR